MASSTETTGAAASDVIVRTKPRKTGWKGKVRWLKKRTGVTPSTRRAQDGGLIAGESASAPTAVAATAAVATTAVAATIATAAVAATIAAQEAENAENAENAPKGVSKKSALITNKEAPEFDPVAAFVIQRRQMQEEFIAAQEKLQNMSDEEREKFRTAERKVDRYVEEYLSKNRNVSTPFTRVAWPTGVVTAAGAMGGGAVAAWQYQPIPRGMASTGVMWGALAVAYFGCRELLYTTENRNIMTSMVAGGMTGVLIASLTGPQRIIPATVVCILGGAAIHLAEDQVASYRYNVVRQRIVDQYGHSLGLLSERDKQALEKEKEWPSWLPIRKVSADQHQKMKDASERRTAYRVPSDVQAAGPSA
eukprot:GFYU01041003.1.p1 GENE.GFYU01041003.1~~GFYU01041003.1.p1  ORF type:complete len:364 (+),score=65.50 GFYU01041003.1:45-1136(+)